MISDQDLQDFVAALDAKLAAHNAAEGYDWAKTTHEIMKGKKYARIVQNQFVNGSPSGRSAHCFIDLENGNIHKADGWAGPDKKHVRGNIANGAADVDNHGARYRR